MKCSYPLLLSFALPLAVSSAAAQTPNAPVASTRGEVAGSTPAASTRVRRAQGHFQRGVDLYAERNYDGALAEFSRAHELVPNYRVLYNLAQTQAERHDYVDAVRLFGDYLEQGGAEIPAARREAAERERDELLERIATVQLESNIAGAELWVDGRSRGVVPSRHTLRLNAGMAEVRLEKAGYAPVSQRLTIVGGDAVVVHLHLDPSGAGETVRSPAGMTVARDEGGASRGLWLSAGATTLLAGATATFAILTLRADSELERELRQYRENPAPLDDARSRVRTYATLTDGLGAATLVGLGATLFFALSGADEAASPADRAERVRVVVGSSGLSVSKSF